MKDYQTLNLSLALVSLAGQTQTAVSGILSSVIPVPSAQTNANLTPTTQTNANTNVKYTFVSNKTSIITTINIPQKAGTYTFTTSASPLPLVIEVVSTTLAPGRVGGQANTQAPESETGKSWWGKVKGFFGW